MFFDIISYNFIPNDSAFRSILVYYLIHPLTSLQDGDPCYISIFISPRIIAYRTNYHSYPRQKLHIIQVINHGPHLVGAPFFSTSRFEEADSAAAMPVQESRGSGPGFGV